MEQFEDLFRHYPEHRVIICRKCQFVTTVHCSLSTIAVLLIRSQLKGSMDNSSIRLDVKGVLLAGGASKR